MVAEIELKDCVTSRSEKPITPGSLPRDMQILLELLGYVIGASALTVLGVLAEYSGLQHLTGGEPILGLWFAGFGIILLYGGTYLLGYEKVLKEAVGA